MDPYPFKHPAVILARIRKRIEPSLLAAGFRFDGRNKPPRPVHIYLDYSRASELFRLSWDRRDSNHFVGFVAELLSGEDEFRVITKADLSYLAKVPKRAVTGELRTQIDRFIDAVSGFFAGRDGNAPPSEA